MAFVRTSALSLSWEDKRSFVTTSVRFDVVTSETHEALVAITDHPVEDGPNVSDHARDEPDTIAIEGFVSNSPLFSNPGAEKFVAYQNVTLTMPKKETNVLAFTSNLVGAIDGFLNPGPSKALVLAPVGELSARARAFYDTLAKAKSEKARIRVVSPVRELENMMIRRLAVVRTPENSGGFLFQVELRRVVIVKSETVDAPMPTEPRGLLPVSKGSQATKEDKKKEEKLKSLAAGGADALSGALGKLGF